MDLVARARPRATLDQPRSGGLARRRRLDRWSSALPVLAVLLGAGLRVRQWAGGRSFWSDELFIVEQVLVRDFSRLATEPLARRQSAPVGWLWIERAAFELFGDSELALRLPSLLLGIGALLLVWRLALHLLPPALVAVPVLLTAAAPELVRYSNEVKQYPLDVVVVLAVLLAAVRVPRDRPALRPVLVVSGLGVAAVWLSMASVFALGAVSAVLVLDALRRDGLRRALHVAVALSPWLVSLGVAYALVLRRSRDNAAAYAYWGPTFPQEGQSLLSWLQVRWSDLLVDPLHLAERSALAAVLLVAAAVGLVLRAPRGGSAVAGTVALGTVAAALAVYPLADRLALWLVPLVMLALPAVLPSALRDSPLRNGAWAVVAGVSLLLVAAAPVAEGLGSVRSRTEVEEMRDLLEAVDRQRQPGDAVVAADGGTTGLVHYGPRTGVTAEGAVLPVRLPAGARCDDAAVLRRAGFDRRRVWVVTRKGTTDALPNGPVRSILPRIAAVATPVGRIDETGAYAVLFAPRAVAVPTSATPTFCARWEPLYTPT